MGHDRHNGCISLAHSGDGRSVEQAASHEPRPMQWLHQLGPQRCPSGPHCGPRMSNMSNAVVEVEYKGIKDTKEDVGRLHVDARKAPGGVIEPHSSNGRLKDQEAEQLLTYGPKTQKEQKSGPKSKGSYGPAPNTRKIFIHN
ncbi:hypothetical protein NDU88_008205 [Pleurodeles waltl]|uniref:Uncharacterized protein n=1 Tax=Pleurodeles waltl TaxID=8319 RepID=A0AAV7RTZ9_PLEWA|nr:hypothetical protein NDU88_008205 [Pleurodeles waltl]